MTVVSVYASTAKAPPAIKKEFKDLLQSVLSRVPYEDVLILLGDLNARVGRGDLNEVRWVVWSAWQVWTRRMQ